MLAGNSTVDPKMQLLSKSIIRRFEESRCLFFTACFVYPINVPFLSSIKAGFH